MQFSWTRKIAVIFQVTSTLFLLLLFNDRTAFVFFLSAFFPHCGVRLFSGHSFILAFPAVLVLKQISLIYFPKGS